MDISKHETLWLQREGAKMISNLGVKPDDCVVDFGSGHGRYTIPLSQVVGVKGHANNGQLTTARWLKGGANLHDKISAAIKQGVVA